MLVLCREDGRDTVLEGPGDGKGGVVPEEGSFSLGAVVVGGFVEDVGAVGEGEEAVGKAGRDPELLGIVSAEFVGDPLAEGG